MFRPRPGPPRNSRAYRAWALALVVVGAMALAATAPVTAATSGTVIGATVPSATSISLADCQPGTNATDFGTVLPGASVVAGAACRVEFGSSNDTASLRVAQSDGIGEAMWRPASGAVDSTYGGGDGIVTANLGSDDRIVAADVAPDGTAVVAADTSTGGTIRVVKFTAAGEVDTTFGVSGVATTQLQDMEWGLGGVAILPSGAVLVAGWDGSRMAVERRTATGGVDATFGGGDGIVSVPTPGESAAYAMTVLASGDIVLAGYSSGGNTGAVAKVTADGVLDTTFGAPNGYVQINDSAADDGFSSVIELPNGSIVASGWTSAATWTTLIVRLDANGALDTTFGTGGKYKPSFPGDENDCGLAAQDDGRLLVSICSDSGTLRLARVLADGSGLDATFAGGSVVVPVSVDWEWGPHTPVVLPTGAVAVAGHVVSGDWDAAVVRYTSTGALDGSFGANGVATVDVAPGATDRAVVLHEGLDGDLVFAGMAGATADIVVGVLAGAPVPDYDDPGGDDWATAGRELFGACLEDASGGATGTWPEAGTCATSDGSWRDVPSAPDEIAATATPTTSALADLRFGLRVSAARPAGAYVAPVTFSVVAPAA